MSKIIISNSKIIINNSELIDSSGNKLVHLRVYKIDGIRYAYFRHDKNNILYCFDAKFEIRHVENCPPANIYEVKEKIMEDDYNKYFINTVAFLLNITHR